MQSLAMELLTLRQKRDNLKEELKAIETKWEELSTQLLNILDATGITSFKYGEATFFTSQQTSVKTPKTEEAKYEFFKYLKTLGLFESMISIDSRTLNKLYKSMAEEALEKGVLDFRMPGIDEPIEYKEIRVRYGR